eukprot:4238604-Amphidinium_carterae.2
MVASPSTRTGSGSRFVHRGMGVRFEGWNRQRAIHAAVLGCGVLELAHADPVKRILELGMSPKPLQKCCRTLSSGGCS